MTDPWTTTLHKHVYRIPLSSEPFNFFAIVVRLTSILYHYLLPLSFSFIFLPFSLCSLSLFPLSLFPPPFSISSFFPSFLSFSFLFISLFPLSFSLYFSILFLSLSFLSLFPLSFTLSSFIPLSSSLSPFFLSFIFLSLLPLSSFIPLIPNRKTKGFSEEACLLLVTLSLISIYGLIHAISNIDLVLRDFVIISMNGNPLLFTNHYRVWPETVVRIYAVGDEKLHGIRELSLMFSYIFIYIQFNQSNSLITASRSFCKIHWCSNLCSNLYVFSKYR